MLIGTSRREKGGVGCRVRVRSACVCAPATGLGAAEKGGCASTGEVSSALIGVGECVG